MSYTLGHIIEGTLFLRSFVRARAGLCAMIVFGVVSGAVAIDARAQNGSNRDDRRLRTYADRLVPELPEFVQSTLKRIPDFRRRLLAMGTYFRRLDSLEIEWAWTNREVADFKLSDEYARMIVEIEKVRQTFAEQNPGYRLEVNIGARSLETQIRNWNTVRSVKRSADDFADSCHIAIADTLLFPAAPDSAALSRFRGFLEVCELPEDGVPSVAVPGLSKHGQLRAFDFRIKKGRRLVAGTTTATIPSLWDGPGWTEKLRQAILSSSDRFEGPLSSPYEPWHYTYIPGELRKEEP